MNYLIMLLFVFTGAIKVFKKLNHSFLLALVVFYPNLPIRVFANVGLYIPGHLTRIAILLIVLFLFYYRKEKGRPLPFTGKLKIHLWLLALGILLSNFVSWFLIGNNVSDKIIDLIFFGLIPFVFCYFFLETIESINQLLKGMFWWGLIFLVEIVFAHDFASVNMENRMSFLEVTGVDTIKASRIFAALFIYSLVNFKRSFFNSLLLIVFVYFVVLAGQRATLIGLLLSFGLYSYKSNLKFKLLMPLVLLFFVAAMSFTGTLSQFEVFKRFSEFETLENLSRFHDYYRSWQIFVDNYFLMGLGTGGYEQLTSRVYPHSLLLESMTEYGLLGLVGLLLLIIGVVKKCFSLLSQFDQPLIKIVVLTWITLFISGLFSGWFATNLLFFLFSLLTYRLTIFKYFEGNSKYKRVRSFMS